MIRQLVPFQSLHKQFNEVFSNDIDKYNNYSSHALAFIIMGPTDPPPPPPPVKTDFAAIAV